jgi:hypothetical protein
MTVVGWVGTIKLVLIVFTFFIFEELGVESSYVCRQSKEDLDGIVAFLDSLLTDS